MVPKKRKSYTREFKIETVKLVTDGGAVVPAQTKLQMTWVSMSIRSTNGSEICQLSPKRHFPAIDTSPAPMLRWSASSSEKTSG